MQRVFTRGFNALLVTQFFGAVNDNLWKQFLILQVTTGGVWAGVLGDGGQGIVTMLFTLPFIVFSGWAGQFGDRNSKTRVAVWMKILEVPISLAALVALATQSFSLGLASLMVLALQATYFGPAKYGMIPEILERDALGRANGTINMLTNVGILSGELLGGFLSKRYPEHDYAPGLIMVGLALAGMISSFFLTRVTARDPGLTYSRTPVGPYWNALGFMGRDGVLLWLCLGGGLFYQIAVMTVLALPDFKATLFIDDQAVALLVGPLMIGIGVGSVLAGYMFKDAARNLNSVPLGVAGMAACYAAMGLLPLPAAAEPGGFGDPSYVKLQAILLVLGGFAGCFIIPFQSIIQARSPDKLVGRILGTYNFVNFLFIAAGGGCYALMRSKLGWDVQQCLLALGVFTLFSVSAVLFKLRGLVFVRGSGAVPPPPEA
ncbi:MAG: MFS transporter [Planctomycetes bacterium]|nr:MFS transporter [Planctomycetota bacterium]